MGDWIKLSKEEEQLFNSCGDTEALVKLDEKWHKMPKTTIGLMFTDAYGRAMSDALKGLGVEFEFTRDPTNPHGKFNTRVHGGLLLDDLDYDYDIESEKVCCTLRVPDGRSGKGFAKLKRLRPL